MHKVRLSALAGPVQPVNNGRASMSLSQEGYVLPVSSPMPAAFRATSSDRLPSSPSVDRNNVSGGSLPSPFILVVEDSLTIRKIVETVLHRAGYMVITFPDGMAALQWLAERSSLAPKLVLLDIGLPKMDGYEIARTLKAKPALEDTTIVMMSCRDGVVDRLKGRLVGAKDYLTKPFKAEELVEIACQYLSSKTDGKVG